jgi:Lon protease-like protein
VSTTRRIPLFPLGMVLMPQAVLPLHIFEPRYRRLVEDLVEAPEGERVFGVVAIRQGREVGEDGVSALYEVGCLAELRGIQPYSDGRFDIVTVGGSRFSLQDLHHDRPYLTGDVVELPDDDGEDAVTIAAAVRRRFEEYREVVQVGDDDEEPPIDPADLAWTVAAGMVLELDERQRILAASDTAGRLRVERDLLHRELGLLRTLPSIPAFDLSRMQVSAN